MLHQDRIILMTKLASYEESTGRKYSAVLSYFRGDYVWFQVMKSVVYGTVAFGIIFGMYVFYDFETFMTEIYRIDILAFAKSVLKYYLLGMGAYTLLTYIIYSYRYAKAKESMKLYQSNLKKLSKMYDKI